jgi:lipopolysaccharide biosynthesis protein
MPNAYWQLEFRRAALESLGPVLAQQTDILKEIHTLNSEIAKSVERLTGIAEQLARGPKFCENFQEKR